MVETIISLKLPAGENIKIQKKRIESSKGAKGMARAVIVTGIHGDELEGQYICYELSRILQENKHFLNGVVDIYPALNPLGIECVSRNIPNMEMDMNRNFPGNPDGNVMDRIADAIVCDINGADLCLDIHASDTFVREMPQVRINDRFASDLLPFAKLLNVDFVWLNATETVHESTLAYTMNALGVPTLVMEMGVGNRINLQYGNQIVNGVLNLLHEMGMWRGEVEPVRKPIISTDGEVVVIRSKKSGVFIPKISNDCRVEQGQEIGSVVDVLNGEVKMKVEAPASGLVFTIREYPMVHEGALLARILTGDGEVTERTAIMEGYRAD